MKSLSDVVALPTRTTLDTKRRLAVGQAVADCEIGLEAYERTCPQCGQTRECVSYGGHLVMLDWPGDGTARLHGCDQPLAATLEELDAIEQRAIDAALDEARERRGAHHRADWDLWGLPESSREW